MGVSRLKYARALLAHPSFVSNIEHITALVAIMASEGSQAHWNPLDTTLEMTGATPYNSFGPNDSLHVWNYPDARTGVRATVLTMMQPNMAPFATALGDHQSSAEDVCRAYSAVPWSSVGDTLPLELVSRWRVHRLEWVDARRLVVPGPGAWPYDRRGYLTR